jgi:hypothetical protein
MALVPDTKNPSNTPAKQEEGSDSDFDLELEYDCSSLTLEQSMKQVFNIINAIKLPSIEKQQLTAL